MSDSRRVEVTIGWGSLFRVVAVGLLVVVLWYLKDLVALVFVSVFLAILISPVADFCERRRLPRALGVGVVYLLALACIGGTFALLAQPLIAEARGLAASLPEARDQLLTILESLRAFSVEHDITARLQEFAAGFEGQVTAGLFGALSGLFGGAISFVLVLVLTFYLATYAPVARRALIALAPARWQPFLIGVVPRIERKMGAWLRGLLLLAAIMALLVFVGLSILRVDYAILIALLAGIAEVAPYLGPILATVIAVLLTLLQSPAKAIVVLIFFIVLQQLENHLLVPKVMQRAIGVHPIVSVIALLVGAKVGGVPGALFAIPVAAGIMVFVEEYRRELRSRSADEA